MNKRLITICLFIAALTIAIILTELIILSVYKHIKYSYNEDNAVEINSYDTKYTIENIIIDLYSNIRELEENEINKSFVLSSKISMSKLKDINNNYQLKYYDYDLYVKNIYCLSDKKQIYSCEYSLEYLSNDLVDGADVVIGEEKEDVTYNNKVIIKLIENNKYKILYSKFDLGGGKYYEK